MCPSTSVTRKAPHLDELCEIVDGYPDTITVIKDDFQALALRVGLAPEAPRSLQAIQKQLYALIAAAFPSGHGAIWHICRNMEKELILAHVLDATPIDPYFSVMSTIRDAVRVHADDSDCTTGDWPAAICYALDHVRLRDYQTPETRLRVYSREFNVANAAKMLQASGYKLIRAGADVSLETSSETRLVERLERLIARMGGLYVASLIFASIGKLYDGKQERYHVVQRSSPTGGGQAQIPFGYLLQLAAKHVADPVSPSKACWQRLISLATQYAGILDVQNYTPSIWRRMDARQSLAFLQETALSDALFCLPQVRGSDVPKILCGILQDFDFDRSYGSGWTVNSVLSVIKAILEHTRDKRGPVILDVPAIVSLCDGMNEERIAIVTEDVLSHTASGPSLRFSKATDAPRPGVPEDQQVGKDLFLHPLLRLGQGRYAILDRSASAPAFIETLLAALRAEYRDLDDRIGLPLERFVAAELRSRGVSSVRGSYISDGEDGECDLVVESEKTIFFLEFKKKALTRAGQAGVDANLILDLAASALEAQVQAGWHEVRIKRKGFLDLTADGATYRLELRGRGVERLALSFLDFGSFQDRMLIQQFLAANLGATYTVNSPLLSSKFDRLNKYLEALWKQTEEILGGKQVNWPFFNCWFLSVPQLLVLLDDVNDVDAFRAVFFSKRAMTLDVADLYYFHSRYGQAQQQPK